MAGQISLLQNAVLSTPALFEPEISRGRGRSSTIRLRVRLRRQTPPSFVPEDSEFRVRQREENVGLNCLPRIDHRALQ